MNKDTERIKDLEHLIFVKAFDKHQDTTEAKLTLDLRDARRERDDARLHAADFAAEAEQLRNRVRELEGVAQQCRERWANVLGLYIALREAVLAKYTAHKTTPDQNEVPSHCMCDVCTIARKFKLHEHCTESPRAVDIPHTDSASELMKRPKQERDEAMRQGAEIMKDEYGGGGESLPPHNCEWADKLALLEQQHGALREAVRDEALRHDRVIMPERFTRERLLEIAGANREGYIKPGGGGDDDQADK